MWQYIYRYLHCTLLYVHRLPLMCTCEGYLTSYIYIPTDRCKTHTKEATLSSYIPTYRYTVRCIYYIQYTMCIIHARVNMKQNVVYMQRRAGQLLLTHVHAGNKTQHYTPHADMVHFPILYMYSTLYWRDLTHLRLLLSSILPDCCKATGFLCLPAAK